MTTDPAADGALMTMAHAIAQTASGGNNALKALLEWVETYLMAGHPELGRSGAVCPFTKQAAKLDTVRLAISSAGAADEEKAYELIRNGFAELEKISSKPAMRHFRTVIVGFPECGSDAGIAMLKKVQRRLRFYSLSRGKMIGLMHATSDDPGLWNPDFRPLRAPLPVLAIRHMVEQDAPFAAKHPPLLVAYLSRFPIAGLRRLFSYMKPGS
ncbi:DUF6875 domain-containing protein [Mesorhizobium sp. NBSH29]|uniref:DUF6875 domain-containing protein n=1 Tax=Mesorhizobium sp. NBSH29 TaxID=2654249 RepID=UPI0018965A2E|nr:hypothetical protein [Mesorhizobium sp. NBSH29]